jgi:nucleoside-diphosphate-sugar epimerase
MSEKERPAGRLSFPDRLAKQLRSLHCDFVITGGGGWIGQAVLEMLDSALGDKFANRVSVFGSNNRNLQLRSGRTLPSRELKHIAEIDSRPKYFVHCAFLTKDKLSDQSVENFIASNQKISDLVAAAIEKSDARGLFTPSSGAVYQKGTHILDDDLQKNAYGAMKIADEKRFTALATKKKMPLSMPRLFNLSGPFINKHELYALSSMIHAVLAGKSISIRAAHRVIRSYIHVVDLVVLAFSMLLEPQAADQPIFDTAGDEDLELGDLATLVLEALGHMDAVIERPPLVEKADDVYVGDGREMLRMMQSRGLILCPLKNQIHDTAEYMRELGSTSGANLG